MEEFAMTNGRKPTDPKNTEPKKPSPSKPRTKSGKAALKDQAAVDTAYFNSDSGPALPPASAASHPALVQARAVGETVDAIPFNTNKAAEYGPDSALPPMGQTAEPADESASASSLGEN